MRENPKYVGEWPWGKTRTLRSSEGKTKQVPVPREQQVVRPRPDLRIVDQETWDKAQQRLRELDDLFGLKPGQKPRGPKPHHTAVYPKSLLGGLVYCHACGSRLWVQGSGSRSYLGCPNHVKGCCAMTGQAPVARAERALTDFLTEFLTTWPGWVESAVMAMRRSLEESAGAIPAALQLDQAHLGQLEKRINNLVDQLADGDTDSPAVRRRLVELERDAESVHARIAQGEALQQKGPQAATGRARPRNHRNQHSARSHR